ncbi:hypothetical protein MVQ26_07330 [Fusobacterium necrophorum]|uniref:hypothetical protein n=1 Tax=Fusobacterium necrophorum TaxID=859 RepID=UPI00254C377D|nr:hypothetical protein [Fusobacterium necrophorum]MDK4483572.1 hypothetical protein [Fusobacterium necrophorum]MDK4499993.1 hypothetical protein [Fusobacterium necrophorum]MDK4507999.1 hypothetical protein [Fusobacterium necrophorum]
MSETLLIKLVILFFPGILGLIVLRFLLYQKVKTDFQETFFYSITLGILSYLYRFEELKQLLVSKEINVPFCFLLTGLITSLSISIGLSFLINRGYFERFFRKIRFSNYLQKDILLDSILMNHDPLYSDNISEWTIIRLNNGTRYVGKLVAYNYKDNLLELFLSDVTWYKPAEEAPYDELQSIYFVVDPTTVTIEYKK